MDDDGKRYNEHRYVRRKHRDLNTEEPAGADLEDEDLEDEEGSAAPNWTYLKEFANHRPLKTHLEGIKKEDSVRAAKARKALKETCYVCTLCIAKPILRAENLDIFISTIPVVCRTQQGAYWVLGISHFNPNTEADYTEIKLYIATHETLDVLEGFPVCTPPVRLKYHTALLAEIETPEWILNDSV